MPSSRGLLLNLPSDISPCLGVPSPGAIFEAQDWAPTLWPGFFKPLQVQGVMASLLTYVPLEKVEPLRTAEGFKTYALWQAYPVLKNFYTQYGELDVCLPEASKVCITYHLGPDECQESGCRRDAHISLSVRLLYRRLRQWLRWCKMQKWIIWGCRPSSNTCGHIQGCQFSWLPCTAS